MKRIVFATWGSYGDLHPFMAIAIELKKKGHDCVIASAPIYREKVEAAGLEFAPVRPDLPELNSVQAAEMIRRVSNTVTGPEYLFRELIIPHLDDTYADTLAAVEASGGADLLVSHQVPLVSPIVAEVTGIPRVSCVLSPIGFVSVYDPPTPPQFPPIRSIMALHPWIAMPLMEIGKRSMLPWVEPVQALRRRLGVARSSHPIFEGQHSALSVLGLFSKVLSKIQRDFPANTRITGFPFYDEYQELRPELNAFLQEGDPPILFTLGSSLVWSADDFFRVSIEATERLGKRALLLVGDMENVPADLPSTVLAIDYVPHHLVMQRGAVTVHPGGIGTTGQALRAGKPMLVVPHGQDQPDNARRCVELGLARTMTPGSFRVSRVIEELSQLIENPSYSQKAIDAASVINGENGVSSACTEIEKVLGT